MVWKELRTVLGTPAGTKTRFHPSEIDVTTRDLARYRCVWPYSDTDEPIRQRFRLWLERSIVIVSSI